MYHKKMMSLAVVIDWNWCIFDLTKQTLWHFNQNQALH